MFISAADQATGDQLAAALLHLAGELLAELGPVGVAVLVAVVAAILTTKSKSYRKAQYRAVRAAVRALWRALVAVVRALVALAFNRPRGLTPTKEERRLLARLAPAAYRDRAEHRGLAGTQTGRARLTAAGIVCPVRLGGKWTPATYRAAVDNVRALLGARTALRIEVTPGKRGGWADLTIRTRSAVDTADMRWAPDRAGIGLDAHNGQPVTLPRARFLLAGSSGAGKSVALRPYLAELAADPLAAVVLVDAKRVEGALWRPRARIARDAAEIEAVGAELQAEMMDRLEILEATGRASWSPTPERPTLVVVVDEGAEVKTIAPDAMPAFESVARMGRAAEVHLVWCTQKPTMSGPSAGIPPQIAAQMDVRAALRLATATEVRTVLGEDATAGGWDAHTLPKPGVLMLRGTGRGPAPVRVWFMDDEQVKALPPAPVWQRVTAPTPPKPTAPPVDLTKPTAPADGSGQPHAREEEGQPPTVEQVLALAGPEGVSVAHVCKATGLGKSQAYARLAELVEQGAAAKPRHGRYALADVEQVEQVEGGEAA